MWSQFQLCLLVGLAFASNTPAWKDNTIYKYKIQSRTLSSLHDVDNQYSGVLLRGDLIVKSKTQDVLQVEIPYLEYAQFHSNLPEGWRSEIPESQLNYKSLSVSRQPFEIVMKNGVVRDLIVNRELTNWEANLIKAIVSQFQLDTNGENLIDDKINTRVQYKYNNAVYKTMEDTVTGITETEYDIHPLPEQILQAQPWLAPHADLKGEGEVIEIVKNKNHTQAEQRPAYHYGFANVKPTFEPAQNQMGDFLTRTSVSRAIITGKLDRYTIQNSYTVEEILVRPTLDNPQKGSVRSILNVTLQSVEQQSEKPQDLSNTISLGNLVYRFDSPYAQSNKVRPGQQRQYQENSEILNDFDSEYNQQQREKLQHLRQHQRYAHQFNYDNSQENSISSEEHWEQEQAELNEAPESPLLPFTVGYQGQSIKKSRDIVQTVVQLTSQIAEELERPDNLPEQNTMGKYVTLVSLVRVMNENEMKQAAQHLYKKQPREQDQEQQKGYHAWMVYRDAVAQAGTGPALLTVQEWIQSNKVQKGEAADIVSVLAHSVRQPTEKYVRKFFEMMKSHEIMQQPQLNDSIILSFADLVHKVYVNQEESHGHFPTHSFGRFRTQSAIKFLENEILPYFTQKLHEAIVNADTIKIHTYIRALGNIGHQQILSAFEPYLEGKKQCSQFQRFLMVVALDKLVHTKPAVAQRVLYRIYQNTNEHDQVRTAAVYHLMKTNPTADLLQRMAEYTNIDTSEQVNAAVKSSIQHAAQLQGHEYASLRFAAQTAEGLLTTKQYGTQYSKNLLNNWVYRQIETSYKQCVQTFGSEDSFIPKGLHYSLRERIGGVGKQLIGMQAMVSSIEDLTNVFEKQTKQYQQQQQQKQQREQHQTLSTEKIARLLNMEIDQNEQLEGNLYIKLAHLQEMLSFDNHTIERLPQILHEIEEVMNRGKVFHHNKMVIEQELAVAFPTEIGWPFIYTYDKPLVYRFEGKIKVKATPQVSSGQSLHKPEKVELELEIRSLASRKLQTQFGFITPFDAQRYSAGYDKNIQVHVPAKVQGLIDLKHNQIQVQIESLEPNRATQLVHYSTWPYTTKEDIFNPEHQHRQIIKKLQPKQMKLDFGKKSTGIAFELRAISDDMRQLPNFLNKMSMEEDYSTLVEKLQQWDEDKIQYCEYNVFVDPRQSTTRQVKIQLGYKKQHRNEFNNDSTQNTNIEEYYQNMFNKQESQQRQQQSLEKVCSDIANAKAYAVDTLIEFNGEKTIKYIATAAFGKSDVNPKSRLVLFMRRTGTQEIKPYFVTMLVKSHIPNTNGLDLTYAMQFDPTSTSHIEIVYGEDLERASRVEVEMKGRKTEERVNYLRRDPMYHKCQNQQKQGNHMLPACANMTLRANFLDRFEIKIKTTQMSENVRYMAMKWYQLFRHMIFSHIQEIEKINRDEQQQPHILEIQGQYSPDLKSLDVVIDTEYKQVLIQNVRMNSWAQVFVPHPVFHMKSRLLGKLLGHDLYRPVCVVDKTAVSEFNTRTYPVSLAPEWTVMLLYVPRRAQEQQQKQVVEQLQEQLENYAVMVRSNGQTEKEVKITVAVPETEQQYVEITLKPTPSGQQPKVMVNGKDIKYSITHGVDMYDKFLQIYGLPNNEVKVELSNAFYVIYDGTRVKLTLTSGKFRSSVRGICGSFTDDKATSLQNPQGCVLRKPQELISEYVLKQGQQVVRYQGENCHQKQVSYVDVITNRDVNKYQDEQSVNMCTKHQTRYIEVDDKLCFTLRPIPVCKSNCTPRDEVPKSVPVHCVQKSNAAKLWKKQIDDGASPDFSLKAETSQVRMQIPQRCTA